MFFFGKPFQDIIKWDFKSDFITLILIGDTLHMAQLHIIIDLMCILVDINEQSYDIFPKKFTSSDNIYL